MRYRSAGQGTISYSWDTVSLDQIDNFLQDQIPLRHRKSDSVCFCDKSSDFAVNLVLVAGTNMHIDDQPDIFWGNMASGRAENGI